MASYGHPSLPFASPFAANRHPRATHQWLLMGVQVCRLPALKRSKPSKPSKRLKPSKPRPRHTSTASYGPKTLQTSPCSQQPPRATHQSLLRATLASNRHPKATHQWLLMGIQVCRLPALKPSKPLQRSKPLKRSKRLKPSKPLKTIKPFKR